MILGWIDSKETKALEKQDLNVKRYMNDVYFEKRISMVEMIKNQSNKTLEFSINEFIPHYLQVYTKDMKVSIYEENENERKLVKEMYGPLYSKNKTHEGLIWDMKKQQNGISLWIGIYNQSSSSNFVLEANQVLILNLKLKKKTNWSWKDSCRYINWCKYTFFTYYL